MQKSTEQQEITCQQVLVEESSVFSTQWMIIPGKLGLSITPRFLLERYLDHIRKATFYLVRPTATPSGVEFRLFTTSFSLLNFMPPADEMHCVTLSICGGFLVQSDQCDRGHLTFSVEPENGRTRVTLHLADYCPLLLGGPHPSRLRKMLYRFTQGWIHKKVTVAFLARIYRELAGKETCIRIIRVAAGEGEET